MFGPKFLQLMAVLMAVILARQIVTAHIELSIEELVEYHRTIKRDSEALNHCLQSPEMREHNARALARHDKTLNQLRKAHKLAKRSQESADKWEAMDHEDQPGRSQDPQDLFHFRWNEGPKNNNTGCALTPYSIYGPYWHEGQPQRQDIRIGQRGIYLRLALQIIDTSRCKPLHGAHVDVWQATAMGDYSGTAGSYLRGWQPTSNQGTVDFDTVFPGHYNDRASHIHVAVRALWEKRVVSIGQIYFDQYLRDEVESTIQYKNNRRPLKSNYDDDFVPYDSSDKFDPFVRWSRLGKSLEDGGLLAWITLGVNTTDHGVPTPPNQKRGAIDWHLG